MNTTPAATAESIELAKAQHLAKAMARLHPGPGLHGVTAATPTPPHLYDVVRATPADHVLCCCWHGICEHPDDMLHHLDDPGPHALTDDTGIAVTAGGVR